MSAEDSFVQRSRNPRGGLPRKDLQSPLQPWAIRPIRSEGATSLQEPSPRTRLWESKQWGNAQSGCPRGLPTMRLWHGTLLVVAHVARTSVALPFPS